MGEALLVARVRSRIYVKIWLLSGSVLRPFRTHAWRGFQPSASKTAPLLPLSPRGEGKGEGAAARLSERLIEVGDEVVDILDADGKANERVADAERAALLGRERGVRHDRGMLDEAFDAAQALGEREDLDALEETPGHGEIAVELGGDHAAEPLHLAPCKRMLRVARKTGIVDARDLGM